MMTGNGIAIAHGWQQAKSPVICYWCLDLYSSPDLIFDDWQIDGQPFLTNVGNLTGNVSNRVNPFSIVGIAYYDGRSVWTIDEFANLPPVPVYTDSLGNVYPTAWKQGACGLTCYQGVIPSAEYIITFISNGLDATSWGIYTDGLLGTYFDLTNASHISAMQTYYQSLYGPQSSLTVTVDINGDFVLSLNNIYANPSFGYFYLTTNLGGTNYLFPITC